MSQEKVDQKKYDKLHRKSLLRKKKLENALGIACVSIISVAIVAWIGFSVYKKVETAAAENVTYEYFDIDTSGIQDYLATLN
ncbi:MAG: hypothetical protein J6P79_13205 [Pseudobutyrivibrio sp.]|nr:hypothetical protein [Pseudobutyrivibrio sp.]